MTTELVEYTEPSLSLINTAIERGVDAPTLEKLVHLDQFLRRQRAEEAYSVALHACQQEMPIIVKDSENPKTRSRFASLENVKVNAKPIYTKHGFTIQFHETDSHLEKHKRTVADCRHNAGHKQEYHVDLPVDGIGPQGNPIGGMNSVQGSISSLSYGQRVLTCMIFDLTIAETDNDGNLASEPIDEAQARTIEEWLVATSTNREKFLDWVSVKARTPIEKVAEMPADLFDEAIDFFKRKQR